MKIAFHSLFGACIAIAFSSCVTRVDAQASNGGTVNVNIQQGTGHSASQTGDVEHKGYTPQGGAILRHSSGHTGTVVLRNGRRQIRTSNGCPVPVRNEFVRFAGQNPNLCWNGGGGYRPASRQQPVRRHPEDPNYRGRIPSMRSNPAFPDPTYKSRNGSGGAAEIFREPFS